MFSIISRGSERLQRRVLHRNRQYRWIACAGAAQDALDQVIATRGRAELEKAMAAGDELAAAQLARGLQEMAALSGSERKLHRRFPAGGRTDATGIRAV